MPSPVTSEDFDLTNTSGDLCDQFSKLIAAIARIKEWFAYVYDSNGVVTQQFLNDLSLLSAPIGSIHFLPVLSVPAGHLLANGQAVGRLQYAALFAVYGTQFGIGDGLTTFNMPNIQNRMLRGWGNSVPGQLVGSDSVDATLIADNLPEHRHGVSIDGSGVEEVSQVGQFESAGADTIRWNPPTAETTVGYTRNAGEAEPDPLVIPVVPSSLCGLWLIKY